MAKRPRFDTPAGLIAGDSGLAELAAAARANRALAATVAETVPGELARHLRGAVLRADELVILADSGAFASRLRFLEPALRAAIAARHAVALRRIVVRVVPPEPAPPASAAGPSLSAGASAALEAAAQGTADPALAAALRRLAARR